MTELHLKQPEFSYSVCGTFTKHCKRIQIFRETGNLKHLYRNKLDKSCFAHGAAYSESKNLAKRSISDRILKDGAYEITRNHGYDGYQRALASMGYTFFDKKTGSGASVNEKLAEELHKPVTKKFERRKVYARFENNVCTADLAQMEASPSENRNVKYLLCIIEKNY